MKNHEFTFKVKKPPISARAIEELVSTPAAVEARAEFIDLHHKVMAVIDKLLGELYEWLQKENPDFNPPTDCVIVHHNDPIKFSQITVRYKARDMVKIWPITIRDNKHVEVSFEEVWKHE